MTSFRYPLPEAEPTSPWGGFSDEARTALTRLAMGPSPANQLLTPDGNGAEGLSSEVQVWASEALNNLSNYFDTWQNYDGQLGVAKSVSVGELAANNPNLVSKLTHLYETKQALLASGESTPEGTNIGETMRLALVPWQEMRNHLSDFDEWVDGLRNAQGLDSEDYINEDLLAAIKGNSPFYRDSVTPSQLLTASQYLDKKIAEDGPVGVMLVQTSDAAGIERLVGQSPDQMTSDGSQHLEVAGSNVDSMGVFEWIALTLQSDPAQLSSDDYSWMLANRLDVSGDPHVPFGGWDGGRVRSLLNWAGSQVGDVRVRLAVM
jgi:hypothetical protein